MLIIPAILTNDPGELASLENKAEGIVNRIQIDVIDNKFADNITIDPEVLKKTVTYLNLDFHLMVKSPIDWIDHCVLGSKNRIIGQIEYMESQKEFVDRVTFTGSIAGLGIDLATSIDNLDQSVLSKIGVILLMSVPAGFGGQEFNLETFGKIEKLVKIRSELKLNFKICVDGGITKELINEMESLGVDEVTVGKRIFEPDLKTNLETFRNG
jgi:ribulose-phosphate 3-epimerase